MSASSAAQDDQRNLHTNWCVTFHYGGLGQPSASDADAFIDTLKQQCRYYIIGRETCKTTAQKHLQGYLQLLSRKRLTQMKKLAPFAHWEPARGTVEQNKEYCSKEGDFVQHGTPVDTDPGKREKKRWDLARAAATEGRIEDIDDELYVRHYTSFRHIMRDHIRLPPNAEDLTGLWIYGKSGAGKSRWAREEFGKDTDQLYLKPLNKWWDGYRDQPYVLLEDFGKEHSCLAYHLKIWGDRYAFPAEIKGSTMALRPQRIVITSQYHPRDIWQDAETLEAIVRRYQLKYVGPLPNPWEGAMVFASGTSSPSDQVPQSAPSVSQTVVASLPEHLASIIGM